MLYKKYHCQILCQLISYNSGISDNIYSGMFRRNFLSFMFETRNRVSQSQFLWLPYWDRISENRRYVLINFLVLNQFKKIQLQYATNKIKIGPLEPEIQPAKVRASLLWAYDVTWCHRTTSGNNIICNT